MDEMIKSKMEIYPISWVFISDYLQNAILTTIDNEYRGKCILEIENKKKEFDSYEDAIEYYYLLIKIEIEKQEKTGVKQLSLFDN